MSGIVNDNYSAHFRFISKYYQYLLFNKTLLLQCVEKKLADILIITSFISHIGIDLSQSLLVIILYKLQVFFKSLFVIIYTLNIFR